MTRLVAWLAAALLLVASTRAEASDGGARTQPVASALASAAPGEAIVEERLLAPCCYMQTLDVHESPLATVLVAAGIGRGLFVRRWRRTPLDVPRAVAERRDAYDESIDAELRELDG